MCGPGGGGDCEVRCYSSLSAADKLIFSSEEMLAAAGGTSITLYLDSQDLMDTTIKRKETGLK